MSNAGENGMKDGHHPGFGPNQEWGESPKSSGEYMGER
jgi:hypothetical protein